jgi:hypothetical protein
MLTPTQRLTVMSASDQARGGRHGSQSPLEDDQARA